MILLMVLMVFNLHQFGRATMLKANEVEAIRILISILNSRSLAHRVTACVIQTVSVCHLVFLCWATRFATSQRCVALVADELLASLVVLSTNLHYQSKRRVSKYRSKL